MNEEWKAMPGHADYEISSLGNARSLDRRVWFKRRDMHGWWAKRKARVLRPRPTPRGYLIVSPHCEAVSVHRLVAKAFIPNPENKGTVNHKNGNKADNRAENLEWMHGDENFQHGINTLGKIHDGNASNRAKLTADVVTDMRLLSVFGAKTRDLANTFGVTVCTASNAIRRRSWAHIP